MQDSAIVLSTRRERMLLWLLAGLQFTHLLDFMILSPLAPQFMRLWGITASQFGYLVSVYALAAALAGLGATFVIDRFDRRAVLLTVYALFVLATVACALAPGYWWLMVARALAGASGGIVGSIVMAIIGDLIPAERRGRAMGVVLSAFPLVSVLGVPVSLLLANHLGWHAPFFTLAAISLLFLAGIGSVVPPINAHLRSRSAAPLGTLARFTGLFSSGTHRRALAAVFLFTLSGFAIFPFLSAYQVKNVGISEAELAWVFVAGGLASIVTSRLVGWSADRFGKRRMFLILACCSIVPIMVMTNMTRAPLWLLLCVSTLFMVLMSGRFIPLMALVTTCVDPRMRGAFMSLSSSAQNLAAGIASVLAGMAIGHDAQGALTGFSTVGLCAAGLTIACILIARKLQAFGRAGGSEPAPVAAAAAG